MKLTTVLHPTDFSDGSRRALELAVEFAVERKATLHLFHVLLLHGIEDPAREAEALELLEETARVLVSRVSEGHDAPVAVESSHARGAFAADSILKRAVELDADLIVMGTHGRSGLSKLLMGSTAEKVLRHATCSVMTVRPDTRTVAGPLRSLLVPVDFSEWSSRALEAARAMVTGSDTTLHLHHVVEPIPPIYYAGNLTSLFALDGDLRNRVEDKLRDWSGDHPRARLHITEGNPSTEIVRVADQIPADLIVMSTRGLTGLEHALVGSVTERVCRFARVPVLTVR